MHVTAINRRRRRGLRFGGVQPKQLLSVGGRPILERSVTHSWAHPLVDAVIAPCKVLVADPPVYLRQTNNRCRVGGGRAAAGFGSRTHFVPSTPRAKSSHSRRRAAVTRVPIDLRRSGGGGFGAPRLRGGVARHGKAVLRQLRTRETAGPTTLTVSPSKVSREYGWSNAAASIDLSRANAAGVSTRCTSAMRWPSPATQPIGIAREQAGHPVRIVEGEASNIKITTVEDLPIAEAIAAIRNPQSAPQSAIRMFRRAPGMICTGWSRDVRSCSAA